MSKNKKKKSHKAANKSTSTKKSTANKKIIIIAAIVVAAVIAGIVLFKTFYKTPEQIEKEKYELTGDLLSGTCTNTLEKYHYRVNKDNTITYAPNINTQKEHDEFSCSTVPLKTAKYYHYNREKYEKPMELNYFEAEGKRVYLQNQKINSSYMIYPMPGKDSVILYIVNLGEYFVVENSGEELLPILNEDYNGFSYSDLNKKAAKMENERLYWVLNLKISDDGKYIFFHTNRRQISQNKKQGIDFVYYDLKTKEYVTIKEDTGDYLSYSNDVAYYADIDLISDTAVYTRYDMKTKKHTKLKKMSYETYVNNQAIKNYYVSYNALDKNIELFNIDTDEKILSYSAPNIETLLNIFMSPDKNSILVLYNRVKSAQFDPNEKITKEAVYIDLESKFATILQLPPEETGAVTTNIAFNGNFQVVYRQTKAGSDKATAYFKSIKESK